MALDPFTAISLAGNCLQFIGFARDVIAKGSELYKSPAGILAENVDLETVTKDLVAASRRLDEFLVKRHDSTSGARKDAEKPIGDVLSGCIAVAEELLRALDGLKVKGEKYRTWKAISKAIRAVLSKGEIKGMQQRLALYQAELEVHLLVDLREQVNLQEIEQTARFQALDQTTRAVASAILNGQDALAAIVQEESRQIQNLHARSSARMADEFEKTRSEMRELLKDKHDAQNVPRLEIRRVDAAESSVWEQISIHDQEMMKDIRDSLCFPELQERHGDIHIAYPETFNWIFEDPKAGDRPWDSFKRWLSSGNRAYWVHGKPGSGKSTLMKFLCGHDRTKMLLEAWAGEENELVQASFFFWNSGKAMQKSRDALLRTILWSAMKKCPRLCPVVLRDEATQTNRARAKAGTLEWTRGQLRQLMENLLSQESVPVKLFFAIDGLDEYEGDHTQLAHWFLDHASPKIKFLLSSRPWNAFRDAFASVPQLRLQDLIYDDIRIYANGSLRGHPRMKELLASEPEIATHLIEEIVTRADGVFLWVRLVVNSLLEGLRNYDRISDLRERVRVLPPDLEKLYEKLLENCAVNYRDQQGRYVLMRQALQAPPLTLVFSLSDEDDEQSVFSDSLAPMTRGEALNRCEQMERRLQVSCAGLLEVDYRGRTILTKQDRRVALNNHDYYRTAFGSHIQYIHRTVRDFFERSDVAALVRRSAAASFDPKLALCRGTVLRMMRLPIETMNFRTSGAHTPGHLPTIEEDLEALCREVGPEAKAAAAVLQDLANDFISQITAIDGGRPKYFVEPGFRRNILDALEATKESRKAAGEKLSRRDEAEPKSTENDGGPPPDLTSAELNEEAIPTNGESNPGGQTHVDSGDAAFRGKWLKTLSRAVRIGRCSCMFPDASTD